MEKGWGNESASAVPDGMVRPNIGKAPHPNAAGADPDASTDGWTSVDDGSGPVTAEDWSHPTGKFPSDGVWKQT